LIKYIEENFPNFWSDIHVRFELGETFENGSDERIKQVIYRVITLFEETFDRDDYIYLYIRNWEQIDVMFGNTTPNYIYELINHHELKERIMYEHDEDIDEDGNTIQIERPYKVKVLEGLLTTIPYKDILIGIANYEQGREPSIGQQVYFINSNKDIIFNMYDDRGCIIFSKAKEKLKHLYTNYNSWLITGVNILIICLNKSSIVIRFYLILCINNSRVNLWGLDVHVERWLLRK
jgi:hypothetical protein